MVERQNVLSTIMLKNVKLSNENVRLHISTAETYLATLVENTARADKSQWLAIHLFLQLFRIASKVSQLLKMKPQMS